MARRTFLRSGRLEALSEVLRDLAELIGAAMADDRLNVTPMLSRKQARPTATLRPASELTTTPSLTPRAPATRRLVADAEASAR